LLRYATGILETSSLESFDCTGLMEVFPFVRYTESSSLEISAEEVWNNLRCATKWEIFRKGLRRIWLASMCGEIYHDTPSWT
jgi:hypothetical protein